MDFKTCYSCAGALFSARKTIAFERVCCSVLFHGNCIQDAHMEFCPSCGAFTDSIDSAFLWNPTEYQPSRPADIVVIEDCDDEGPSRPRRNATTTCAICLEDGSLSDKLLETSCCSQRAHVSCLRRHFDIPGRCRTELTKLLRLSDGRKRAKATIRKRTGCHFAYSGRSFFIRTLRKLASYHISWYYRAHDS